MTNPLIPKMMFNSQEARKIYLVVMMKCDVIGKREEKNTKKKKIRKIKRERGKVKKKE